MSDGYEVDAGKLTEHAEQVRGFAESAAQVADAGDAVTPGGFDLAYGIMFQWWPQATRPISQFLINSATEVTSALRTAADQVDASATDYRDNDERARSGLDDVQDKLGTVSEGPKLRGGVR